MSGAQAPEPLRLAIEIGNAALAGRIAALLCDVAGLELVPAGDPADVRLVPSGALPAEPGDTSQALTPRELEVLALLAEGASNKLIARRLGISAHTAKFHVASVIGKLDAVGRTDAVTHALRLGVIEL